MNTKKFLTYGALGGVALYLLIRLKKTSKPSKEKTLGGGKTDSVKPLKPIKKLPTKAVLIKEEKPDPESPQVEPLDCKGKNAKWLGVVRASRFRSQREMEFAKKRFLGDCYVPPRRLGGAGTISVSEGANLGNDTDRDEIIIGIETNNGNPKYDPRTKWKGTRTTTGGTPIRTGGGRGTPIDDSISDGRYRPKVESRGNRR
jgi:hypothetical protein